MKLKYKVLSGFLILAIMLIIAGTWSILQVRFFGNQLEEIISNNYEKIESVKSLREYLISTDRNIFLSYFAGNKFEEFKRDNNSLKLLIQSYRKKNTGEIEDSLLSIVEKSFDEYILSWKNGDGQALNGNKIEWYNSNIAPLYNKTFLSVENLINYDTQTFLKTSSNIRNISKRATIPGIVAIIAAIVFALLFNYFANHYIIKPIDTLRKQVDDFIAKGIPLKFNPLTDDEIAKLAESIYLLTSRVNIDEKS